MESKGDIKFFQDRQGIFDDLEVDKVKFEIIMNGRWLNIRGSYGGDEILFQINMSPEKLEELKEELNQCED